MLRTGGSVRIEFMRMHIAILAMCILAMVPLPAYADAEWQQAGFVIDYGDGRTTWLWIPFNEPETKVIDLLKDSPLEMVTIGFGGIGEGVCQIDDTGCPAADCRAKMCQSNSSSPFWRFLKLNGEEWSMMGRGVSGANVSDGDIFALSWSAIMPDLPIISIDDISRNAEADSDAKLPQPAMRTEGESSDAEEPASSWILMVGSVTLVLAVAGILIARGRASQRAVG